MENNIGNLSITRRPGELTIITNRDNGERIKIKVATIKGRQVILRFSADKKYKIDRKELYNRINREVEGNL